MSGTVTFSCELPVLGEYDVFIAGGGPAGTAAAWAAARCGARVFLAERSGCFGGMGDGRAGPRFCRRFRWSAVDLRRIRGGVV